MKLRAKQYVLSILLALSAVIGTLLISLFVYKINTGYLLRNSVFVVFYALGLIYIYFYCAHFGKLEYDNNEHPLRYFLSFFVCIIITNLFPLIDIKVWFFVGMAVTMALFSNSLIGIYSVSGMIIYSSLLAGNPSIVIFFVYFLSSIMAIMFFQDIEHNFNFSLSIFSAMLIMFVLETAGFILLANTELNAEQFVMPIVNMVVNSLILFFVLKFFNQSVSNKYRNKYLIINDQEYKTFTELREKSEEEYFRCVHTAYLAERMAALMNCDINLTKTIAYYHRIKNVFKFSDEQCIEYLEINEFPPEAVEKLKEYFQSEELTSKETGIVYLCDLFICTIMTAFKADAKANLNYSELVKSLLKKEFNKPVLSNSLITRQDLNHINDVFLKETLYYDFLR